MPPLQASSAPPIQLDNLDCLGDEASLADCRRNAWGFHDCSHSQDMALRCWHLPRGACVCGGRGPAWCLGTHVCRAMAAGVLLVVQYMATCTCGGAY